MRGDTIDFQLGGGITRSGLIFGNALEGAPMVLLDGGYVQDTGLGRQLQYGNALLAVDNGSPVERPLDGDGHIALLHHALDAGVFARVDRIVAEREGGDGGWHWR